MNEEPSRKPDAFLPTRASLLSRIKNWEDQESWRDFYDTYWRLIYEVARKAGLRDHEADEALQETVIAVANEIRSFKYDPVRGSFKAWLLRQTRWRISDQFRKRNRHESKIQEPRADAHPLDEVVDPATENLTEDLWNEEWHRNMLSVAHERVRKQVDPRTFQLYQLHVLQEWPADKTAKSLGVSRALVYVGKHRVSTRIKRELQRLEKEARQPAVQTLGKSA